MLHTVSTTTLADLLKEGISLIDVREEEEYREGHVPGAHLFPLSRLEAAYQELNQDQHHYIICRSGNRSERACQFLANKGYQVSNVAGGTLDWAGPLDN